MSNETLVIAVFATAVGFLLGGLTACRAFYLTLTECKQHGSHMRIEAYCPEGHGYVTP